MTPRHLLRGVLAVTVAVVGALAVPACDALLVTKDNPLYCDSAAMCKDAARPYCDAIKHECVADSPPDMAQCKVATDCPAERPVCEGGSCRACRGGSDDGSCQQRGGGAPRCEAGSGRCVACRAATQGEDCKGASAPVCDEGSWMCRGCQRHAECASGACLATGSCAPPGSVYTVNNGGKKPADCAADGKPHDGSAASPFCDIKDALGAAAPRTYVVVAGSAEAYGPVSIADQTVTLLGPGLAGPRAIVAAAAGSAAVLINANTMANVTLDGMDITAATMGKPGINCNPNGAATLTLTHSSIHDNNGPGLQATNCTVTLDGTQVTNNQGGGIKLSGGTYTITNTLVATNNGVVAPGITFDDAAMGTFAFNTVAGNLRSGNFGGINCGAGMPRSIEHSIVAGNSQDAGSQFFGKCMLTNVVTGTDKLGGTQLEPVFVDLKNSDFHLKANDDGNKACCVDKVASPATPNKDHDLDGNQRPKGAAWDIGAHEVM